MDDKLLWKEILKEDDNNSMPIFGSVTAFEAGLKMATELSKATIIPKEYQNNPANILIALEIAMRVKSSPLFVMENLYICTEKAIKNNEENSEIMAEEKAVSSEPSEDEIISTGPGF